MVFEENIRRAKQKYYVPSHLLLRYLITSEDKIDTLICCQSAELDLVTYDYDFYLALGSIKEYDDFAKNKLTKLFEVITVRPYEITGKKREVLTDKKVEELRKKALAEGDEQI